MKKQLKVIDVHITNIKIGDTVLCPDNKIRTVGKGNIKYGFMRTTLWGDSYRLGTIPVKKIILTTKE